MPISIFIFLSRLKTVSSFLLAYCLTFTFAIAHAQEPDPLDLIDAVVDEVLADIAANNALYQTDGEQLRRMVNQRIAPHFNFMRITQLAMGKNWPAANADQRRRLADAFQALLVRAYAGSLLDIPENPKEKYSIKSQQRINPERMVINLAVARAHGDPVQLSLRLELHHDAWQVIDVVIDGVSMVITYRSQFEQKLRTADIEGLIESLQTEW